MMLATHPVFFILAFLLQMHRTEALVIENGIVFIYAEEQQQLVNEEMVKCYMRRLNESYEPQPSGFCPTVWDGIMCWGQTPNGTLSTQRCANYFNKFNITDVTKKLQTLASKKDLSDIQPWIRSIKCHLYWIAATSENSDVAKDKLLACCQHLQNNHTKCAHGPYDREKLWLMPGTRAGDEIEAFLKNPQLVKKVTKMSPYGQTTQLESFHSLVNQFAPKMIGFSYSGMLTRLQLAGLHFNENSDRLQSVTKDGKKCYNIVYPKFREEPVLRKIMTKASFTEASKECLSSGKWYHSPIHNRTWTNYTPCVYKHQQVSLMAANMPILKFIYNTGYSISLISLLVAVAIMLYFKKLRCPRTSVHVNLFLSFILRAAVCLLKEVVLVNGVALSSDLTKNDLGVVELTEGSHWECKFLMTLFNYMVGANCIWIFMEGLYLHNLLFWSVFSESSSVIWYIVAGWSLPFAWIVPWIIVRIVLDDYLCWNAYKNRNHILIVRVPMMFFLVINFIFFINIVRVLFTKLRASNTNTPEARAYRYRTLARSTLVLIPLFGIHYMVFGALPENVDQKTELIKLYFESTLSSIQGFIVALLFCFLNGEVQAEIKKKWYRYKLRRNGSVGSRAPRNTWNTVSSYVTRARHSLHSINFSEKHEAFCMSSGNQPGGTTSQMSNGSTATPQKTSGYKSETVSTDLRPVQEDEEHEPMMTSDRA